ncbi:unnamed protein product, partial [marine sediment metagenome]
MNIIKVTEEYIADLTKLRGYFTFLESRNNRVAVFRRLSFVPPDEVSITRWRLQNEITPKIKTSVLNGFLVGEVHVDKDGLIHKGLSDK